MTERDGMVSFGGLIADLRKAQGMSQAQFAQKIGVSRNYLSMIECNKADNLSTGVFFAIAKILCIEPHDLFKVYTARQEQQTGA